MSDDRSAQRAVRSRETSVMRGTQSIRGKGHPTGHEASWKREVRGRKKLAHCPAEEEEAPLSPTFHWQRFPPARPSPPSQPARFSALVVTRSSSKPSPKPSSRHRPAPRRGPRPAKNSHQQCADDFSPRSRRPDLILIVSNRPRGAVGGVNVGGQACALAFWRFRASRHRHVLPSTHRPTHHARLSINRYRRAL